MNASRRYPGRLLVSLAVAGVVLVIGSVAASGQTAQPPIPTIGTGTSGSSGFAVSGTAVAGTTGVVSSGISAPVWCCGATATVPGLTAAGQATITGRGTAARDAAIVKAVQDATEQAQAAAGAAGIQLGPIVDLQISSAPMVYPLAVGAGSPSGPAGSDPAQPVPYLGSVCVTITWSLG
ncbi:MAG: SIMPL domain-containing protein [Sciscionella sp.]